MSNFDRFTIDWTVQDILEAGGLSIALEPVGILEETDRTRIRAAAPHVRRAARTLAQCQWPRSVVIPDDPDVGPLLPPADALRVVSTQLNWTRMEPFEADEYAEISLAELVRHHDIGGAEFADLIGATLLDAQEVKRAPRKLDMLRACGEGDTALALGLERALWLAPQPACGIACGWVPARRDPASGNPCLPRRTRPPLGDVGEEQGAAPRALEPAQWFGDGLVEAVRDALAPGLRQIAEPVCRSALQRSDT